MRPMLTKPQGYWVSGLRRRKELIPVPKIRAYRCITTQPEGPEKGDIIVADQKAFDDILIDLGVYPKRNLFEAGFASLWSRWHMDKIGLQDMDGPRETLLYLLDSPHRPR